MKKMMLFSLFLLLANLIMFPIIAAIAEKSEYTLSKITPSNEYERITARLTPQQVEQISNNLKTELNALHQIKQILTFSATFLVLLLLWLTAKMKRQTTRFDGLTLLIINILLFSFHWLFDLFSDSFVEGYAAINIRINTSISLLILQPILFFLAHKWTEVELSQNLHAQKWVSFIAMILAVLSGLLALIIGIGVLVTPDVSGFTS